ncbi:hypothetical protein CRI94_15180 [Longibacter salinarum]|uniref:Uncharacterized protein n=1 Tax=Longibacter salinarum TaxID=1850348 RepID=A0A2A8CUA8_9BACT|nr:hypothetical protein [Longibacter salinarum]PEN11379.1 hypothetical protein CRI94_15180 [Longibacter salinarum]
MHLLYSLISVMLVGVLALSAMRMSAQSEQRMLSNEIMTQVTGVADEVFDHADDYWFDERVNESNWHIQPPIFPIITTSQTGELTSTTAAPSTGIDGWGGCSAAIYTDDINMGKKRIQNPTRPETCDDVDDLHGLQLDIERDGLRYAIDVAVEYVDPNNPTVATASKTFAKRINLTISLADYQFGSNPLQVEMSRIFTYERITTTP